MMFGHSQYGRRDDDKCQTCSMDRLAQELAMLRMWDFPKYDKAINGWLDRLEKIAATLPPIGASRAVADTGQSASQPVSAEQSRGQS